MYIRFLRVEFAESERRVIFAVEPVQEPFQRARQMAPRAVRESIGDFNRPAGWLHFLQSKIPGARIRWIEIHSPRKKLFELTVHTTRNTLNLGDHYTSIKRPDAFSRIMLAARPYFGAPLVWGHNRGHGDLGFDPFTFVLHVYKKALHIPIVEVNQLVQTGYTVDFHSRPLVPGDLLVFSHGRHVGIYTGLGELICVGGGNSRVGYQRMQGGKFTFSNLTMVRRLF